MSDGSLVDAIFRGVTLQVSGRLLRFALWILPTNRRQAMGEKEKKAGRRETPPAAGALTPFGDMERLLEGIMPFGWMRRMRRRWPAWEDIGPPFEERVPRVDVIEQDEAILVHAELPGVRKEDLDVSLAGDRLTIKAKTQQESEESKGGYHRREISRGELTCTVRLPASIDADKAEAKFVDGLLELTLPKTAPVQRQSIKLD
jgi:HSP20 family protein